MLSEKGHGEQLGDLCQREDEGRLGFTCSNSRHQVMQPRDEAPLLPAFPRLHLLRTPASWQTRGPR